MRSHGWDTLPRGARTAKTAQRPCPRGAYRLTGTTLTEGISYYPSFCFSSSLAERGPCDGGDTEKADSPSHSHGIGTSRLGGVVLKAGMAGQSRAGGPGAKDRGRRRLPGGHGSAAGQRQGWAGRTRPTAGGEPVFKNNFQVDFFPLATLVDALNV